MIFLCSRGWERISVGTNTLLLCIWFFMKSMTQWFEVHGALTNASWTWYHCVMDLNQCVMALTNASWASYQCVMDLINHTFTYTQCYCVMDGSCALENAPSTLVFDCQCTTHFVHGALTNKNSCLWRIFKCKLPIHDAIIQRLPFCIYCWTKL